MNNVHFAIPEIYGETLSYYELLRKLVDKTNELIENYNTVPEQIAEAVANLDSSQLFSTVLNQLIHSIATDNTKSTNAVKVYKKHDLLYATFNETVNLYESLIDFSTGTATELIPGTNIREVNISELFIELRKMIDINKNNIDAVRSVANENSADITTIRNNITYIENKNTEQDNEITTIHGDITAIENKNTEQDNELSTLRTMISSPYNFKGDVASISALPASGNINDTYYVQDVKYKVTWTGSAWVQSSLSEADYQTELSELKSDIVDLDNLFDWGANKTNILNSITPTVGEYVDYSSGTIGRVSVYEWYEIPVTEGQTFKYNGNNAHVAFFSKKYDGTTNQYYLSGLLTQENQVFTVPKNAISMTLSVEIDYNNWLGKGDDEYRENTTIKKECLPEKEQIIVGGTDGTYTNIVKAVKECAENTTIIVRSGVYDLEAQFKEVYGNDFFTNYNGYTSSNNYELSGLYLKRGVKLIADSGTVLSFMYSGNNSKVSEEFSPINMTVDNIVDGLTIEVNSNVRYHIHDDFAFMAFMNNNNYGQNEIKNCIFKGNSTAGSVIGGGMGTYCKYLIHDNYFENTMGNAISYHNASFSNAQNFIDIFNNYAETPIKLWWYGDSKKITNALVHNNTASLIECTKIPNYDAPNENIKMKAWNNSII